MSNLDVRSDADLVSEAKAGDHAAWAALVRRHAPRLAAYLGARLRRPAVVEQLVAEAVVATWTQLPALADPEGFAALLRRTGAGLAIRWARERPAEAIAEPWPDDRAPGPDHADLVRLDALIGALPETERMALELRWRGGLDAHGLAAALRCPADEADRIADAAEARLLTQWNA